MNRRERERRTALLLHTYQGSTPEWRQQVAHVALHEDQDGQYCNRDADQCLQESQHAEKVEAVMAVRKSTTHRDL